MWHKHSFGFYELFWLSEKWIAHPQVIRVKGKLEMNQRTWSMCSRSSNKSFWWSDLQFQHKSWYLISRNPCCDIQNGYKTILEFSLNIWFDSGSIGNFKIIPILAGLMIPHTSLFHANLNKLNNIQPPIFVGDRRAQRVNGMQNLREYDSKFLGSPMMRYQPTQQPN